MYSYYVDMQCYAIRYAQRLHGRGEVAPTEGSERGVVVRLRLVLRAADQPPSSRRAARARARRWRWMDRWRRPQPLRSRAARTLARRRRALLRCALYDALAAPLHAPLQALRAREARAARQRGDRRGVRRREALRLHSMEQSRA